MSQNPVRNTKSLEAATDGILTVRLRRWESFHDLVERRLQRAHEYIWRGHRRSDWALEPTIDRLAERLVEEPRGGLRRAVLEEFKFAVRGRRGANPRDLEDDALWALGQHFGLATPLLDWTRSPFAAAFFAFEEEQNGTHHRVVYGLHRPAVERANTAISRDEEATEGRPPILEIQHPLMDENARLVSQGGMFTRAPEGMTVEEWVSRTFTDGSERVLVRVEIPDTQRLPALRSLNRMNINALSLFPDLDGAARHVNMSQLITDY